MEFLDLKYLLFSGIFLSGIGGYPPPPLNRKSSCPKTLSGKRGYPPPLTEKIRFVVFEMFPHTFRTYIGRGDLGQKNVSPNQMYYRG